MTPYYSDSLVTIYRGCAGGSGMMRQQWEPLGYAVTVRWRWTNNRRAAIARYRGYTLAVWRDHYEPNARDCGGFWGRGIWRGAEEVHVDFHAMLNSNRAQCSCVEIAHHASTGRHLEWPAMRHVSVFPPRTPAHER